MNPLITIVLPVYNCEKYISHAIQSILNQTFQNWELLICDDGSTDNSFQIINRFNDNRIWITKNNYNIGSLKTRNDLFSRAKGDYIALQDADDFSEPQRLSLQYQILKNSNIAACGTWARYVKNGKVVSEKKTPHKWLDIKCEMKYKNPFCSASVVFKKEILYTIPGYRIYFSDKGNYDYDFNSRIAERYPCMNIQEFLYNVRIVPKSNSRVIDFKNPIKLESHKIVQFLIHERETQSQDSIERNEYKVLERLNSKLLAPYSSDKLLAFDKHINHLIDVKLFPEALLVSFNILVLFRFSRKSIRLFLYSIKRLLTTI